MKSFVAFICISFVALFSGCKLGQEVGTIVEFDNTYTVTASCDSQYGSVSVSPVKDEYDLNDVVTVTATPNTGYSFSHWTGTRTTTDNPLSFSVTKNESLTPLFTDYAWTFIVYMCADNDLEEPAIEDFNELEAVDWNGSGVRVLVLIDRASGYDSTNGDWTDTRLYEVTTDPAGDNQTIVSTRVVCPVLGISAGGTTELNLASPTILSQLLTYVEDTYPARQYGLLVWGHGTGWRSDPSGLSSVSQQEKAVAWDETSDKYMPIVSFGSAISNKNLSLIGFDTCFGALLEVSYEIRNDAGWFVGSEGLVPSTGWNYSNLFTNFIAGAMTSESFCDIAIDQFKSSYSGVSGSSISKVSLGSVDTLATSFNSFASALANGITNSTVRTNVLQQIMSNVRSYHATSYPCDDFLDIKSLATTMIAEKNSFSNPDDISSTGASLLAALSTAVPSAWSKDEGATNSLLGVYFTSLISEDTPSSSHSTAYIHGSDNTEQSSFVRDFTSWVPNAVASATSFIDKIFYWSY